VLTSCIVIKAILCFRTSQSAEPSRHSLFQAAYNPIALSFTIGQSEPTWPSHYRPRAPPCTSPAQLPGALFNLARSARCPPSPPAQRDPQGEARLARDGHHHPQPVISPPNPLLMHSVHSSAPHPCTLPQRSSPPDGHSKHAGVM
jgi:hypothetical protein